MATSHGQRVFAFVMALLFLLSTVSIAGFFLWDYFQNSEPELDISSLETQQIDNTQQETTQSQETPDVQDDLTKLEDFTGPVVVDELRFDILTEGDGAVVQDGDTITIHYTGALASDGTVFDSSVSRGQTATFPLDNLIEGWKQGIPGMKVGEKRRLYIPADLGYGVAPEGYEFTPGGRPLGDLIFDIELFDTQSSQ